MQSTFGIFDDLTGSVFFGEHDREDAGGFFWVSWIFGTVPHRLIVIVVFEKELLAVNLEAAEIMLLVRIVVRSESAERSGELERPRSNSIWQGANSSRHYDASAGQRFPQAIVERADFSA